MEANYWLNRGLTNYSLRQTFINSNILRIKFLAILLLYLLISGYRTWNRLGYIVLYLTHASPSSSLQSALDSLVWLLLLPAISILIINSFHSVFGDRFVSFGFRPCRIIGYTWGDVRDRCGRITRYCSTITIYLFVFVVYTHAPKARYNYRFAITSSSSAWYFSRCDSSRDDCTRCREIQIRYYLRLRTINSDRRLPTRLAAHHRMNFCRNDAP